MSSYASIIEGRDTWSAHATIPRHRHERAYAAIILSGGYQESGSRGRYRVGSGHVLLHRRFDAHDWPDLLARDLLEDPQLRLDDWAECHGLTPAAVSRGFARVFETSPAAFRAEARAHRAFALIPAGTMSLAGIAAAAGFADQAHMTRAIRALTGRPPGHWLRSNRFKTPRTVHSISEA